MTTNHETDGAITPTPGNNGTSRAEAFKELWRNTLTVTGSLVAIVALVFMVSLLVVELVTPHRSPYLGLFTFLVFPVILVLGLVIAGTGLVLSRRRFRRLRGTSLRYHLYPRIDLADPGQRRYFVLTACGIALALPVVGVLSYEGYHYTDSNQFCGAVCHTVMEPQYTAFQQSPHAHVGCAECHIGAGASWYVKSKLSGVRQVFAVALNSFPRPIPPAIQELRPATETCRECHWPSKFYGDQLVNIEHFAPDESNTHSQLRMLLKTGGSDPTTGPPSGIHWHMALGFTIEYVAADKLLQDIRWVKMTDQVTGRIAVYRSDGRHNGDPLPEGTHRTVDCMDCHNRPTHIFKSPDRAVNSMLNVNPVLQTLPFAKREAVAALVKPYASRADAHIGIADLLAHFYQQQHPKIWETRKADVDKLILLTSGIFSTNFFPAMNVTWRTYPDNIGHKVFPGCFRCHDGKHVDDTGRAISHECGTCHEFLRPTEDSGQPELVSIGGFQHPIELQGPHAAIRCDQCHTGGIAPDRTCAGCHADVAEFRAGTLPALSKFRIEPDSMAEVVKCEDCHDLSKPKTVAAINERCMDCHSDDEEKYGGLLASWKAEVDQQLQSARAVADSRTEPILAALQTANPLHNISATRKILQAIGTPSAAAPADATAGEPPAPPGEK